MKNTTITLAYINTTENPLHVFCNLFIFLLQTKSANGRMRIDELQNSFSSEFGLKIPIHVLKSCATVLANNGNVRKLRSGGGYQYIQSDFDVQLFQEQLIIRKQQEDELLYDLQQYLQGLKVQWSLDETRENLLNFFVKSNYAYYLFTDGVAENWELDPDDKKISSNWYISQYLKKIERAKDSRFNYVIDMTRGLMIYIGLCQFPDYTQNLQEKFKGTKFFFDTKLVLRYLGYSWPEMVTGTRELVNLLREEYGGQICIFQHTYQEICSAISTEIAALTPGNTVRENWELECFRRLNSYKKSQFSLDLEFLEHRIVEEEKITIEDNVDVTKPQNKRYNIDLLAFVNHICTAHPKWKRKVVENDVDSINQINIMRRGNYNTAYGGSNNLPIFVTTNYALISSCRSFFANEYQEKGVQFQINHLPIIADSALTYRLWLPKASTISADVPGLSLSRIVYAAQQENSVFYQKFKENLKDYNGYGRISIDNLSEHYSSKLFEIVARNSDGEYENFTEEVLAQSLDEFMKIENMNKDHEIAALNENLQNISVEKTRQETDLIDAYKRYYLEHIPIGCRLLALLSNFWWAASAIVVVILTLMVNHISSMKASSWLGYVISVILFLSPFINKLLDKIINRNIDFIQKKIAAVDRQMYIKYFNKHANSKEKIYQQEIISRIFEHLHIAE